MKRAIFIYSNFDFSVKNAGVTRMRYYAQACASHETAVYLVTCSDSPINQKAFKEIHTNIFVLEGNSITTSFLGTFKFIKNLFNFSKQITESSSFLFYPSPLVYLEVIALYYLKFRKKRIVFYELNEIRKYTSTFQDKISIKHPMYSIKKIIYKAVFSTLEFALPYYDGLVCISTAIKDYGQKFNPSNIRIPILTNPDLKKEFSNNNYSNKETFNIGFSGSIHPVKENLLNFFNVLGQLKSNNYNFQLNLCGLIEKDHQTLLLERTASKLKIKDCIHYFGNLDQMELSTFLSQQQLLIIPRGFTLQNNYGFSTKLSDYLDHSKPVLVTDISDNKLFIEDNVNGFLIPPDDNSKMFEKLKFIISNYNELAEEIEANSNTTSRKSFYYKNYSEVLRGFLFKSDLKPQTGIYESKTIT